MNTHAKKNPKDGEINKFELINECTYTATYKGRTTPNRRGEGKRRNTHNKTPKQQNRKEPRKK